MSSVELELIRLGMHGENLFLSTTYEILQQGVDPVLHVENSQNNALTHSTSWRWSEDRVILTFVQVFADDFEVSPELASQGSEYHDASSLPPIECHAVRHLYFLLHTDEEINKIPGLKKFWDFAHEVAEIHHPAVAGFVTIDSHH